ncbi:MAG: PEP-CTERM sorting domain-containing protein [Planctomycetia bacterium]|nr:PEP-CTERM sorting domain-containing protein [Planctomycetia bacterium]
MRTPGSNSTFGGKSLTIGKDGSLVFKTNTAGGNIILENGGSIVNGNYNNKAILTGTLTVKNGSISGSVSGTDIRTFNITAKIIGDSNANLSVSGPAIYFSNSANDFKGTLTVADKANVYLYNGNSVGSLGDAKVVVGTDSALYTKGATAVKSITLNDKANTTVDDGVLTAETLKINAGTATLAGTGKISLKDIQIADGATLTQTSGTLTPNGDTLTFSGDYNQNEAAILQITPGSQTVIIDGEAFFDGILELEIDENFDFGENIYAVIQGEDENYDYLDEFEKLMTAVLQEEVNAKGLALAATGEALFIGTPGAISNNLPEPSTWALLALGFGLLCLRKRRG